MKKKTFVGLLSLLTLMLIASCSQKSKFESAAKEQMEKTLKELAKDPSSVKISNVEVEYADDSLCIVHADFTAKNGLGTDVTDRGEYIYIASNGKVYETYQEIKDDESGIFISPETYDKQKKGTIYESLPYESGLRYLSAIYVNDKGREVGSKEHEDFIIPVPTGTGSWDLKSYKDEFGEEGTEKYLLLMGSGVFSNSATTNSDMTAILFVDKDGSFSFKLIEYNSSVVKSDDSYSFRIKDSEDVVHDMVLFNNDESGQMSTWGSEATEEFDEILKKGGIITIAVRERNAYSTPDTYLFRLNVSGYEKAKALL